MPKFTDSIVKPGPAPEAPGGPARKMAPARTYAENEAKSCGIPTVHIRIYDENFKLIMKTGLTVAHKRCSI